MLICIGKKCRYNNCNAGEHCGLENAFPTKKGDGCWIDERINELRIDMDEIANQLKTFCDYRNKIEKMNR